MRILFLTQYFPPEIGASQNRLSDLAHRLAEASHTITVVTAMPNYPEGQIYPAYRNKLGMIEHEGQLRIVRAWLYTSKKRTFLSRLLNYLSFCVSAFLGALLAGGRADVVYVDSPPLFLAVTGYLVAKVRAAKFVLNIADLWPESAVVLGMIRNKTVIEWATKLEEGLYRRAELVTGQTEGIVASISRRCSGANVLLLTNGVSPESLEQAARLRATHREILRESFGFTRQFVVAYTGVHGLAQRLETLLQAAVLLRSQPEIQLYFYGDGPEKTALQKRAVDLHLDNVHFCPPLPSRRMPELLVAMDVSIVPLKRNELFKGALPSKLFEALGAGVVIVGSVEGEAQRVIERSKCGICVQPENAETMANAILTLFREPDLRKSMGEQGFEYARKFYNRQTIADNFAYHLKQLFPSPNCSDAVHRGSARASAAAVSTVRPRIESLSVRNTENGKENI